MDRVPLDSTPHSHPDSAADEVISGAGVLVQPPVEDLADTLRAVIDGQSPPTDPVERAQQYDWDAVADQAKSADQAAIDGL